MISCIYCKYVLPLVLDTWMCVEDCVRLAVPFSFGSTMRSGHNLGGWMCRLNLSMFLLTISAGSFWSVHSVLEFNVIKKNLRIMSNIERVFCTVLFRMAFRVFLFFTPSDSSLVLLLWNWSERLSSRSFPGGWDGLWSLDGSCICHFSPAPSSLPSLHSCPWLLCIPKIHIIFFPCQRPGHPAFGL